MYRSDKERPAEPCFSPEFIAEDMSRDKKVTAGCTYSVVSGKSAS